MSVLDILAALSVVGVTVVWGAYPLAMAAVGRFRRGVALATTTLPRVSVVIATREDAAAIRRKIENCLASDYPADRLEIIVARDAASAAAGPIPVEDGPDMRFVTGDPPGGKASSLNSGVREASGDLLVFADTHQMFDADTISKLVAVLDDPAVGAVSGSLTLAPGSGAIVGAYWRFERWLRRTESLVHSCVGVTGAVWAMRRELWQPLPAGLILDDVYTPMRVVLGGHRVRFTAAARATETRSPDPVQEYDRKVRTLTGVLQLCAWLPAVLVPIRNPVWLQFVFHKLLRLLTPYGLALIGVWLVVHAWRTLGVLAAPLLLVIVAVSIWLSVTNLPAAARARRLVTEAILLQWAVIVAGFNGVRGRWEVWGGDR